MAGAQTVDAGAEGWRESWGIWWTGEILGQADMQSRSALAARGNQPLMENASNVGTSTYIIR